MVFSQSIVVVSWAFLLEGILMWVRTALFTSLTSYRSWLIELVRVTARRLGSCMTLLGGAPDPYEQKMIKSATLTRRPTFNLFPASFADRETSGVA